MKKSSFTIEDHLAASEAVLQDAQGWASGDGVSDCVVEVSVVLPISYNVVIASHDEVGCAVDGHHTARVGWPGKDCLGGYPACWCQNLHCLSSGIVESGSANCQNLPIA